MAIGGKRSEDMAIAAAQARRLSQQGGTYDPEKDVDPRYPQERKMSRIGPPVEVPGLPISDSDSNIVGKQMELEADNAIKYRTCSWQKVHKTPLPSSIFSPADSVTIELDPNDENDSWTS